MRCPSLVPNPVRAAGRGFARERRGTAAVEFAIVLPVILFLLLGLCIYGLYLGASHNLNEIAAAAARASVAGITDEERSTLARQRVDAALAGGSMFPRGSVSVQVGADPADVMIYRVTLSFDAKSLGLSGLSTLLPMPAETMRSTVSVRRGGL